MLKNPHFWMKKRGISLIFRECACIVVSFDKPVYRQTNKHKFNKNVKYPESSHTYVILSFPFFV